jgi:hypothetical protein
MSDSVWEILGLCVHLQDGGHKVNVHRQESKFLECYAGRPYG